MSKILSLSTLGAEWYFDYNCNIVERPYIGHPLITNPQTEVTVTGKFDTFVVDKPADLLVLDNWFFTGSAFVYCPLFDSYPIDAGDVVFDKHPVSDYGLFSYKGNATPFIFGSWYRDPEPSNRFRLEIRPVEKGYTKRSIDGKTVIEDIPFTVVPHKVV